MIITCPACATQFRVPDGALGSDGRKLRCSSCRHVWFQVPLAAPEAPQAPEPDAVHDTAPDAGPEQAAPDVPDAPPEPTLASAPEHEAPAAAAPVSAAGSSPAEPASAQEPPVVGESPAAPVREEPAAQAPVAQEPGAVQARGGRQEDGEAPRAGLRLVPREERQGARTSGEAADPVQPALPAYDVTRVVGPDAAPDERPARPRRRRGGGLVLLVLLLLALGAGLYFERTQVMRFLPQTASLYGLVGLVDAPTSQGLRLQDVVFRIEDVGGAPTLVVSGKVMNVAPEYRLLPELRVLLLNERDEATSTWALRTTAEGLAPGATTVFEAAYADPPRTGADEAIFVTFADMTCAPGQAYVTTGADGSDSASCITTESSQ